MGTYEIKKSFLLAFAVLCISLFITNILLMKRLSELKRFNDALSVPTKLQIGAVVPSFVGYDGAGRKVSYDYGVDTRKTVLLILSPTCHACDENWPNWNRLISMLDLSKIRLVIANINTTAPVSTNYVSKHGISNIPLLSETSPETMAAYKLGYTPQTIVIAADGKVEKVEIGLVDDPSSIANQLCNGVPSSTSCGDNPSNSDIAAR